MTILQAPPTSAPVTHRAAALLRTDESARLTVAVPHPGERGHRERAPCGGSASAPGVSAGSEVRWIDASEEGSPGLIHLWSLAEREGFEPSVR